MKAPSPPIESPWLTTREAVRYLRLGSKHALYRLVREHRCPFGRVGEQYRFHRLHLDEWVATGGASALRIVRTTRG